MMDMLGLTLERGALDRLQWIVAGHRVGAQWPDRRDWMSKEMECGSNIHGEHKHEFTHRYLGGPSALNKADGDLCLWMAWDPERGEMLAFLSMSIKLHAGRTIPRRRMFLIVPSESLRVSSQAPLSIDKVPEALFERPDDGHSARAVSYLSITFNLHPEQRSKVVMTTQKYPNTARGTPLALLDSLKSLSEAPKFILYMNFNTYALNDLTHIQAKLHTSVLTTPKFVLSHMYPGGHDGGFDLWEAQGWCSPSSLRPKKRKRLDTNVDRTPSPPPAYPNHRATTPTLAPSPVFPTLSGPVNDQDHSPECPVPSMRSLSGSRILETPIPARVSTPTHINNNRYHGTLDTDSMVSLASRLYKELPLWLCMAWKDCPTAHYLFIDHLLEVGAAAWVGAEERYHNARVACTLALAQYRATLACAQARGLEAPRLEAADEPTSQTPEEVIIAEEPARLISWALMIDPTADMHLFPSLTSFEVERQMITRLHYPQESDKDAYDALLVKITNFKAMCVVDICFRMGERASRSEKRKEMVRLMAREMQHHRLA